MKRTFRILATFLSIALLICALPQSVLAQIGDLLNGQNTEASETDSLDVYVLGEVIDNRTETSKTFRMSDGSFIAADYGQVIHYAGEDGTWTDYDNTLTFSEALSSDSEDMAGYGNTGSNLRIKLANNSNSNNLVKLTTGDYKISLHLVGANKSKALEVYPAMEDPTGKDIDSVSTLNKFSAGAIYEDILPDVDLEYIISGDSVKENIIIKDTADSYTYTFELKLHGLVPEVDSEGNILLKDETTSETQLVIPAGYMFDANDAYSDAVSYNIAHKNGKKYTLTVTADADWINADDRAFPVTVDPTMEMFETVKNTADTYISQNSPTSNNVLSGKMVAGYYYGNSSIEWHALIEPEILPAIPETAVVVEAALQLQQIDIGYTSVNLAAVPITQTWDSYDVTWNTKPTYGSDILDYVSLSEATEDTIISFDITRLAQTWYNGSACYGVALIPVSGNGSGHVYLASSDSATTYTHPRLMVSYRDTKGVEDHWTYSTQTIETGTGYVNHYSGSLVYVLDLGLDTGDFPYAAEYVYNSYLAGTEFSAAHKTASLPLYDMSFGNGWQLNFLQTLVNVGTASAPLYVYTDTDGTDHYFEYNAETQKYEDEDGLGYVLNVSGTSFVLTTPEELTITFSNGIISSVSYEEEDSIKRFNFVYTTSTAGSRLNKIVDEAGNTILSFTYSGNAISAIKQADDKCATFTYSGNSLSGVHPNGGKAYDFTYSSGRMTEVEVVETAEAILYTHALVNGVYRVSQIQKSYSGTIGETVNMSYADKKTVIETAGADDKIATSADNIHTVYLFDNYGQTINIYAKSAEGNTVYNAVGVSYDNSETFKVGENNIQSISATNSGVWNRLKNTSVEDGASYWTTVSSSYSSVTTAEKFIGNKAFKTTMSAASATYQGHKQSLSLAAGTFTFSAYVKTTGVTGSGGALLAIMNSSGTVLARSEYITGTTSTDIQNGWRRISATVTLSSATTVSVFAGLYKATGTVYTDALQLESGNTYSEYNLIESAGFEQALYWTGTGTSVNQYIAEYWQGNCSAYITGDVSTNKSLSQTINLSQPAGSTFVLSGWAKGSSVKIEEGDGRSFKLRATVRYSDADATTETFEAAFNPNNPNWQYTSCNITPSYNYTIASITVSIHYDKNANTAYFDCLSLTSGGVIVLSEDSESEEETATCTCEDTACGSDCSCGGNCEDNGCDCSCNGRLISIDATHKYQIIDGIKYTYTYDSEDRIVATVLENVSGSGSTDKFYTSTSYYTETGTDTYEVTAETDERGNTTIYKYLNDNLMFVVDAKNITTAFEYNSNDLVTKLSQTIGTLEISNNYTYDGEDLIGITHKEGSTATQAYTFTYDVYGNLTAIKQGSTALVTYAYNANNGKLISATYANGFVESYVYDALDNIYQVRYNNTVKYSYYYDNSGVLQYVVDVPNGTTEYYECDANGNQIRTVRYKTSDKSVQLINEVVNNADGQVTGVRYIHADGTVDYYGYTYDEDGKITQLVLPSHDTWEYEEDIYGRLTSESIVKSNGSVLLSKTYSYLAGSGGTNASTHFIGSVAYSDNTTYSYTYDAVGNITEIKKNGTTIRSYVYDELNQLIRENNHELQQYVCYTYDYSGNIQSKTSHAWAGTVLDTDTYTYGNSQWGDLLTNYNGTAISYDASGNPLKWRNVTNLNWQGRKLTGLVIDTMGMQGMNFGYNADGIRTKKSHYNHNDANMYEVSYVLDGTKILSQTYSHAVTKETYTVKFFYDANDAPIAMEYDGNYYYYRTNIQGDIEGIYNSNGTLVVSYSYDAWGNILSTTGTLASTVGEINPFRYRGYYYDTETGWYYLQSRYYDPTVSRFLNADDVIIIPKCGLETLLGTNLFSYCANSPVANVDVDGKWFIAIPLIYVAYAMLAAVTIVTIGSILSSPGFQRAWQQLYNEFTDRLERIIERVQSIADTLFNVIMEALQKAKAREKSEKTEKHHIVAQNDYRCMRARLCLYRVGIGIHDDENTVRINYWLHRYVHTDAYHTVVDLAVVSAYNCGGTERMQKLKVETVLASFKATLSALSKILD